MTTRLALLCALIFAAFSGACERQSYQETRPYTHHNDAGEHGDAAKHEGAPHGEKGKEAAPAH